MRVADTEWSMATVTSAPAQVPAPRRPLSFARLSDELLARQVARGSERAFVALYERYHQRLYQYCRSIVRNDTDAQDALQSTFLAALSALRRGKRSAPLRPWLYRIARNESITLLRRRSRESDQELAAAAVSSAEDEAACRARWALLLADLTGLPERQRSALLLREMSGLSHEEIAITLGTNVGAAKQAIFEARQGLMELAEGRAMSCDDVRRRLSAGDRRVLRGRRVRAHVRDCSGCAAFAAAIEERTAELRAFAPALPSAAAAAVLTGALRASTAHGGSGPAAGSAVAAGAAGKVAGTALTWKALTGVALIAGTAAGVTGIGHALHRDRSPVRGASAASIHRAAAATKTRAAGPRSALRAAAAAGGGRSVRRAAALSAHGSPVAVAPAASTFADVPGRTGHGNAGTSRGLGAAAAPGHVKTDGRVPRGRAPVARGRGTATGRGHASTGPVASGRPSGGAGGKQGSPRGKTGTRHTATTSGKSHAVGGSSSGLTPLRGRSQLAQVVPNS